MLRAVLHTLRDRLPVESAVAFGAELPMLARGFYYEGWRPSSAPIKMTREEFLGEIERATPFEKGVAEISRAILAHVKNIIEPTMMDKIKDLLPKDMRDILP